MKEWGSALPLSSFYLAYSNFPHLCVVFISCWLNGTCFNIISVSSALSHVKQMLFGSEEPVDSLLHHHVLTYVEAAHESAMTVFLHPCLKEEGHPHAAEAHITLRENSIKEILCEICSANLSLPSCAQPAWVCFFGTRSQEKTHLYLSGAFSHWLWDQEIFSKACRSFKCCIMSLFVQYLGANERCYHKKATCSYIGNKNCKSHQEARRRKDWERSRSLNLCGQIAVF